MTQDATPSPSDDELFDLIRREIEEERAAGRVVDAGWLIERHGPRIMQRFALLSRLLAIVGRDGSGSTPSAVQDPPAAPPAESAPAPEVLMALPDEIGEFQILRSLGQGGMGVVFLARQKNLNRLVALKVLSPLVGWDKEQLDRFQREILTASRLRHPNIAHVYTSELQGPIPHYAMEYIDGQTLGELAEQERGKILAAGRTLDSGSRRRDFVLTHVGYVIQAARALEAVHNAGIIHRDLKPQNLMIGPDGILKLVDFGLARGAGDLKLTKTQAFVGTPVYMSPEALAGRKDLDARTDVYGLGMVLYEILTGKIPYRAETAHALCRQIESAEPVHPRRWNPHLSGDLETIILKAIAKAPADRYQSAGDLAADLERFLRFEPIHARRAGRITRFCKFCRRRPPAAAAMCIGLALLIAAAVWAFRPATVSFTGPPGAMIEVARGGEAVCSSVIAANGTAALALAPADYRVRVSLPKHIPADVAIRLGRGPNPVQAFHLDRDMGAIEIHVTEGDVKVRLQEITAHGPGAKGHGDDLVLSAPLERPVQLDVGTYKATYFKDGAHWRRGILTVRRGETAAVCGYIEPIRVLWRLALGDPASERAPYQVGSGLDPARMPWISRTCQHASSPAVEDVDGDGTAEVLVGTSLRIVCRRASGLEAPPGELAGEGVFFARPAVGDLDGDGAKEIVAGTWERLLYCYDRHGAVRWSHLMKGRAYAWPQIADVDGDGAGEVVVVDQEGIVSCLDREGKLRWAPRELPDAVSAQQAIVFVPAARGRGLDVVAACDNGTVYWIDGATGGVIRETRIAGAAVSGLAVWRHGGEEKILAGTAKGALCRLSIRGELESTTAVAGDALVGAPAAADLDGDGLPEVVVASRDGMIACIEDGGRVRWSLQPDSQLAIRLVADCAAGDLNGDGKAEIAVGSAQGRLFCIGEIDGKGEVLCTYRLEGSLDTPPRLADLDGDGLLDVVISSADGDLCALSLAVSARIWALKVARPVGHSPAIADTDGDGENEVLVTSADGFIYCINLDGTTLWKHPTRGKVDAGVLAADIDADGRPEILAASSGRRAYCLKSEGRRVRSMWRGADGEDGVVLDDSAFGRPVAADLDGDGAIEVLVATSARSVYAIDRQGNAALLVANATPSGDEDERFRKIEAADLDGDGSIEILVGDDEQRLLCFRRADAGRNEWSLAWEKQPFHPWEAVGLGDVPGAAVVGSTEGALICLGAPGRNLTSAETPHGISSLLAAADLDNDGVREALVFDSAGTLFCFGRGGWAPRWSCSLGCSLLTAPCVGDVDGDGVPEIAAAGADGKARIIDRHGMVLHTVEVGRVEPDKIAVAWCTARRGGVIVVVDPQGVVHCHGIPDAVAPASARGLGQVK
ncbi:MAG TPA: hypothetical protein DCM87_06540 [Planctomycetes bacterium]|nr:hypothetical protein [Planctomycetota bacterium]